MNNRLDGLVLFVCLLLVSGSPVSARQKQSLARWQEPGLIANRLTFSDSPNPTSEPTNTVTVIPLTAERLEKLLNTRLSGGMGNSFGQFANRFVVMSLINMGNMVGLVTGSDEIENTELESPFPQSYQPTMREFLDAISLQTHSKWHYDPTGNFIRSQSKNSKPVKDVAVFEFIKAEVQKPYQVTLANGWQSVDRGNWVMCKPPTAPVGMDIYELGSYSADDGAKTKELLQRIPTEIALEWARRVKPQATSAELKKTKVGEFDAILFEASLKSKAGSEVHWRHWVFMADSHCYLFLSTIFPDKEATLLPDVEAMLKSFRLSPVQSQKN
jgi:hypothetical protein